MSKKAEARQTRRGKKHEKQVRLREKAIEKLPRYIDAPQNRAVEYPTWRFTQCDWEHNEWGWCSLSADKWLYITQKLSQFETMTWQEITGLENHSVPVEDCPNPDTLRRLQDLLLDDVDTLFSLRLSARERIYGIFHNSTLLLLWYDPNHTVWPSPKKHT